MKYELILFDADGTLFDYNKGERFALKKSLSEFGVEGDFNELLSLYRNYNSLLWKEFELNKVSAESLKSERFKRLFSHLHIKIDAKTFSDTYLTNLSQATFLIDGALQVVNSLANKIKMVIISNGLTKVQRPRFNSSKLGKFMQDYIISEEIGLQKPHVQIFEYTFNKLGHSSKKSAIIVGDNLGSDILGGNNFGIDTCWFNQDGNENNTDIIPTYTISRIHDLVKIL